MVPSRSAVDVGAVTQRRPRADQCLSACGLPGDRTRVGVVSE